MDVQRTGIRTASAVGVHRRLSMDGHGRDVSVAVFRLSRACIPLYAQLSGTGDGHPRRAALAYPVATW